MQIRTRLTLQFLLTAGVIMIIASAAIYIFAAHFIREEFYRRLSNRANNTARMLIEVDEIDAELLTRIEANNPVRLPDERIVILDYRNNILYSSDEKGVIKLNGALFDRIRLEKRIRFNQGSYEILGLLYQGRYERFVVIAAATNEDGIRNLKDLGIILLLVCLTSFLLISAAGWIFADKALEPISAVVTRVEEISISSLDLRVDEGNGTDEIARLARTFNKTLERLEDAFKLQKDFISNASHELRTPLTSIHGQLEVLLMKERSSSEYTNAIASVLEDIKNLTDLSNRLLLLAQTASDKYPANRKPVRIDEILCQVKEEIQKFRKEYNIEIIISPSMSHSEQMVVPGDESLIRTAFSNIIENACKYSDDHFASVEIESEGDFMAVTISDNGIGIPDEDMDSIFEPFHRGSNVKQVSGHGIGIPLVYRIIKNHNGTINISSRSGYGTKVVLRFPLHSNGSPNTLN
jgi:signal transduction histidine kinase